MADRPVLFRDAMVVAILDGRKDVTRRVGPTWARVRPGDRLWVREAWAPTNPEHPKVRGSYRADGMSYGRVQDEDGWHCVFPEPLGIRVPFPNRWRPSIHMPRWASRLSIEVVSVTEQRCRLLPPRLPDLDDAEATREGFPTHEAFINAWLSMHGAYEGPVYRVEFRRAP